jgi:hypothetical protein
MDKLYYRLTSYLVNKNEIPGMNLLKIVKFQNLVEKCCNVWKISLTKFANFHIIVLPVEIVIVFELKV